MEEDFDDFDFDIIDQIETNYAASKQQQNVPPVSAPPTATWQPAQQKQPTAQQQQQHWIQNLDQRWDHPHPVQQMQQQQHAKQPSWQAEKQPATCNSNTRLSKPFAEHNAQQQTCMQQQTAGIILNPQQQSNWQEQRGAHGQQTVQGVWQPSSRQHQRYRPSAQHADKFQQKDMHSTYQQQQQPALYQLHSQQQQQWPSHAVDHQQQQQQQESTMARLMQALHSTHLSTAQDQATAAAHKASNSRPIAAVSASAAGVHKTAGNKSGGGSSTSQLSGRANTRPVVHQDNTMLPYQQQPAMQQRKHARQQQQQQGKGKSSVPQSGQQPGIQNFFQIDQQKQQQRDIQRLQQQQAAQQRREIEMQQEQQHQRSRPAGTGIHLQHDEVVIDVTSDDDLTLMQDESPVAQQAARQQPWAVPHHQQRQIPQQQQQQQPDPQSIRPQQQQQQQQQVRQLAKQVISDPLAVQQLLSMAYPGTGKEGSTLCCPSPVLSHCPASTMMKGEEAPARRINKEAAKTWLYPSGSVREYQYQIAYTAIRHNTLACLPTGLGKTFIAAVVMYNFYRWFPRAKIAFVAPTRPLVDQQLVECLNIMGFHKDDVAKLLGIGAQKRRQLWETKRIIFSTPQTLENDLKNGACPSSELVCLVVDECHRATGDHAMANIVKIMRKTNEKFRVLALSATPGNNHAAIQEVIRNMMIHKVDFRSEDDASIRPYCHQRTVETVLVPVSQEGQWVTHQLLNLMHPLVMSLNTKCQAGLMVPNERHLLSSHTVMEARRKSQITMDFSSTTAAGRGNIGSGTTAGMRPAWAKRPGSSSSGSSDLSYQLAVEWEALSIVARIADAFELKGAASALDEILLVQQIADGVRGLAAAAAVAGGLFASGNQKTGKLSAAALGRLRAHSAYNDLVERLKALAASPHPKLEHLGQQLQQHFAQQQQGDTAEGAAGDTPDVTRAIVFCSFRDQVAMLAQYLRHFEPDIIARPFVGQGNSTKKGAGKGGSSSGSSRREAAAAADGEADQVDDDADGGHSALVGMKQNEQKKVLDEFRAGEINVLLATCIGEEGLDIPQVDLIVCWDSGGNPSRARQRMGRTGRSRPGRVVYLLSEGREHEKYEENLAKERQVKEYLRYADQRFELCNKEVPLLPADVTPTATLITLPSAATAIKAGPAGRGSKRKAPTAAAEESAAAAGSRKRAATRQPKQAAHPAVAAADNAPLGMGYAALKRARTSKNKPKVVEDDDDDGWESDQPDQQQQQQQHWRQQQQPAGVWQKGSSKPAQTTGAIAHGSSVELPLQVDAGRGSCGPDSWSDQIEPDQSAAAAAKSHCGTISHQQHQQCEQPVCWCESDDEDNADVPLAQRLAAKQQQHTVAPGPVSIAVSSDSDADEPLVTRLAKKQQQQQQQQQGELAGHAAVGPGSQQADLTLAERQQQLLQQQQALVKKPVKKLVSKKKRLAAAAPNAAAAAAAVPSSAAAPSPRYQDSEIFNPSAVVSAADLPAEQPGLVWEELDDYADLFDRDEWLLPTEQQQRGRQQQNAQAAAALARSKPNTEPPVADLSHFTVDQQVLQEHDDQDQGVERTAEDGQPMQLFSFHTAADARPSMTMHANAAAVLLPPNSWATQQMLRMYQQQQQGEDENAASMCECIPETPLSAAGTLSAAAASGGRSNSRPQSSCPPPPAAAAAADPATKVLAGLLDHLMQPMSTAELQVAAADGQLSGHRLAGLALLQAHQVTDDHQHDGDLLLNNYNTQRRAAAAAAIDGMQTAEQNAGQDQQAVKSTAAATVASDGGDHDGDKDDLRLVQNVDDLNIDESSDLDADDQATVCVPWRVKPKGPSAATAAAVGSEGNTAVDVLDVSFKDAAAQPNQPATAPPPPAAAVVNPGKQGSGIAVNKGKKRSTKRQQQQQQTGSQSDILGDLPLALLSAALPAVIGAAAAKPRRQRKNKSNQQQRSFKQQQQPDSQGDVIGSLPLALLPAALPAAAATARAAGAAAQKGDRSAGSGSQQQQRRDRAQGITAVVKPPIAVAAAAAETAGGDDSNCKPCQQHWLVPASADLAFGPGTASPAAAAAAEGHNGDDTDSWLAQSEADLEAAAAAAVVNAQQQQPTQQESLDGQQQQQQVPALTATAAVAATEENIQADSQPFMAGEGLQYLHHQQADISQQAGRQCGPLGVADHATADASIQAAKQRRLQSAAAVSPRGAAAAAADTDHIGEADHHDAADPDSDPNTWVDLGNTAAAAAAAATTGVRVPDSHHQQHQQQQPVWQQPSWRSLAGVGKNRSKALRKQQQLVASSWDEVCTQQQPQPQQQQQGTAAAAVSAAVRPASGWDDFWTQPDPQEADAAAESEHESQGEDTAADDDHHHHQKGPALDPPGSSPQQQQQQQVTSGLSAPADDGADDAVDAGICADDDLDPQQICDDDGVLLPDQACEQDPVLMQEYQQQQQQRDGEDGALPQMGQEQQNGQVHCDQAGLMSPPPMRTPHSAAAAAAVPQPRRASFSSAAKQQHQGAAMHQQSAVPAGSASRSAAAAAGKNLGRCTWEADDLDHDLCVDLDLRLAGSSSKAAKPPAPVPLAAAAAAAGSGRCMTSPYVLHRRRSSSSGGGGGGVSGVGSKTPGSDDAGLAAAGFKRRRRRGGNAILMTQQPADNDDLDHAANQSAAATDLINHDDHEEGQTSRQGDGKAALKQQQQGRLKRRLHQHNAPAAGTPARPKQRHTAAAAISCSNALQDGARKKPCLDAAAAAAAKHKAKRCVFIDEAAADSDESEDHDDDLDEDDDDHDLSGFIATDATTPSAATDRSTPGISAYHRTLMTQTPVGSGGKVDIWALLHGKNRARPERYQKSSKHRQQQQQRRGQHGERQAAAHDAGGGWHNARSKPQQQQQYRSGYLLESPDQDDDDDLNHDEPAGLTLADTPSDHYRSGDLDHGDDLDEYETEDDDDHDGGSGSDQDLSDDQNHHDHDDAGGEESQPPLQQQQRQIAAAPREDSGQQQQQQGKPRQRHQVLDDSDSEDDELAAAARQQTARLTCHSKHQGRQPVGAAAAAGGGKHPVVHQGQRGKAKEVICLDSSESCSSSGKDDSDSDDMIQQRRKQPAAAAVGRGPHGTRAVGRRRAVVSDSSDDDIDDDDDDDDHHHQQQQQQQQQQQRSKIHKQASRKTHHPHHTAEADQQNDNADLDHDGGDDHFDECAVCCEGGELLMCDRLGCQLSYHLICAGLRKVPQGDWYCPACREDMGLRNKLD